jgi:hypothetical protein
MTNNAEYPPKDRDLNGAKTAAIVPRRARAQTDVTRLGWVRTLRENGLQLVGIVSGTAREEFRTVREDARGEQK